MMRIWCIFIDNGPMEPDSLVDIKLSEVDAKIEIEKQNGYGYLKIEEWEID